MKHIILAFTTTIILISCQSNKKEEQTKTVQVATTEKAFFDKNGRSSFGSKGDDQVFETLRRYLPSRYKSSV